MHYNLLDALINRVISLGEVLLHLKLRARYPYVVVLIIPAYRSGKIRGSRQRIKKRTFGFLIFYHIRNGIIR